MVLRPKLPALRLSIALIPLIALAQAAHAQLLGSAGLAGSINETTLPAARAPLLTYGIDAGIGESDNVTLAPTDKISQTIAITDADFAVNEQTRLLDVNAKGNFSYLDYLQNAYGGQLIGRFDGIGNVVIVPEGLTWAMRDDFGQAAIDPYTPTTPTNLENVNYFSTGPDLFMRLGGINFIRVSARYARADYGTSPYNSNRLLGSVALGRDVSAGSSVSLNGDFERVMFANTVLNTDFDRTSAFARYEVHGARTDFKADLGATRVSQAGTSTTSSSHGAGTELTGDSGATTVSEAGTSTTGSLAKFELSRQLSARAKLTLAAGHDLTDAAASFSAQQGGAIGAISSAPAALTSNNYTTNYASLAWQYLFHRTSMRFTARWERDIYPGQPTLDLKRPGAEFNLERRLTRAFTAQLLGRWYKTDYPHALVETAAGSSNYDDGLLGGALIWRHGRGLEIRMRYDHASHLVSEGNTGYTENRVFLTIGYRPNSAPAQEPQ